jgi:(p)ppGpp synthase/HD superfamily hydrolase
MNIWDQDKYTKAWNFASRVHNRQLVPGTDIPYINHIGNVSMEAMAAIAHTEDIEYPDLLVQCSLLHDVIEDADIPYDVVASEFGVGVADGVLALSKDKSIPVKEQQMTDSLERIRQQPKEIWMVKLADRITNLQPPPTHWDNEKINKYKSEAELILETLGSSNKHLADRLKNKILEYRRFL